MECPLRTMRRDPHFEKKSGPGRAGCDLNKLTLKTVQNRYLCCSFSWDRTRSSVATGRVIDSLLRQIRLNLQTRQGRIHRRSTCFLAALPLRACLLVPSRRQAAIQHKTASELVRAIRYRTEW